MTKAEIYRCEMIATKERLQTVLSSLFETTENLMELDPENYLSQLIIRQIDDLQCEIEDCLTRRELSYRVIRVATVQATISLVIKSARQSKEIELLKGALNN